MPLNKNHCQKRNWSVGWLVWTCSRWSLSPQVGVLLTAQSGSGSVWAVTAVTGYNLNWLQVSLRLKLGRVRQGGSWETAQAYSSQMCLSLLSLEQSFCPSPVLVPGASFLPHSCVLCCSDSLCSLCVHCYLLC